MSQGTERRRRARQPQARGIEPKWVMLQNVPGRSGEVRARIADTSDDGLGLILPFKLREDEIIVIKGLAGTAGNIKARVVHCGPVAEGYHAGLAYEEKRESAGELEETVPDYYEILQISNKADPEMIHRVYRILAQRYHPDNTTTGNDTAFRAITEAYSVLSDPEKRAAYDVNFQSNRQLRWQIFDQHQAVTGKAAEKVKRRGILDLLYTSRRNQPAAPSMTLHELEDLLGCPREHLEFSLWYLKENGLISRSDNARYSITAKGVDLTEGDGSETERSSNYLLPAAQGVQAEDPLAQAV
ncbi:MAG TPA: DnaJ domain-containing protein [Bryobacteraceae bacterium]|nr:DnaJ domain-containing protein [Bryobacteraceae bacterium]